MRPMKNREKPFDPNCIVPSVASNGKKEKEGRKKKASKATLQFPSILPFLRTVKSLIPRVARDGRYLVASRGCNIISSKSHAKGCYYAYPMAGRSSYVSRAFRAKNCVARSRS